MQFWRFLPPEAITGEPLQHSHSIFLVFCSLCIAVLAASVLLPVIQRAKQHGSAKYRLGWKVIGSLGMGIGIWGMHFTGMLAMALPIDVGYDPLITMLSALPAIAGSALTILLLHESQPTSLKLNLAALAMASGIGAMHYIGMEAIITSAQMSYDILMFGVSIGVAFLLALAGLYAKLKHSQQETPRFSALSSSLVLGAAVTGMHYAAMSATRFHLAPGQAIMAIADNNTILAVEIVVAVSVIIGLILIGGIIDERQQRMHTLLRDSQAKFTAIVNSMPDGAIVISVDGCIVSMNKAVTDIFGCRRRDFVGLPVSNLLGDDAINLVHHLAIENDTSCFSIIHECDAGGKRIDGSEFPIELIITRFEMDDEQFLSLLVRNIEIRRAKERQLRQAQKLESIGHLAAGIAHEINTPTQYLSDNLYFVRESWEGLRPVIAQVEAIAEDDKDPSRGKTLPDLKTALNDADFEFLRCEVPSALDECIRGIEQIKNIVTAMVAVTGSTGEVAEKCDVNQALRNVITLTRGQWNDVADIQWQLNDSIAEAMLIGGRFDQAMIHLVSNAIHAIEDANLSAKGIITIASDQKNGSIVIKVRDNGCGIENNLLGSIFDHFYTTKEPGRGSGQGLSTVHAIICEAHGGEIDVDSVVGRGTTITLTLPANQAASLEFERPQMSGAA
ncbi:MAG: MHYT domain-containing protein [Woeseiaceae bacterium]